MISIHIKEIVKYTMEPTSHFIGIKLQSRVFVDLFIALQQYCVTHQIEKSIEFQDIHSLHISLYYLKNEITQAENNIIKNILNDLHQHHPISTLRIQTVEYFSVNSEKKLAYLRCTPIEPLQKINTQLSALLHHDVIDNTYTYIPHISLFKILKYDQFQLHEQEIRSIIVSTLDAINRNTFTDGYQLFEVNSRYHPEIVFCK